MNETLNRFLTVMSNLEAAKCIASPPPDSPQLVTTALKASQPSRVKPGIPSNFDGDRVQGHAFLMSYELFYSQHWTSVMKSVHPLGPSRADMW
jgi:hypothetical protein